jgi:hypothetical protein
VASEGSSLVRQNVFPAGLEVPINLKHNSAENASFSVKKAQASRCAPPTADNPEALFTRLKIGVVVVMTEGVSLVRRARGNTRLDLLFPDALHLMVQSRLGSVTDMQGCSILRLASRG